MNSSQVLNLMRGIGGNGEQSLGCSLDQNAIVSIASLSKCTLKVSLGFVNPYHIDIPPEQNPDEASYPGQRPND